MPVTAALPHNGSEHMRTYIRRKLTRSIDLAWSEANKSRLEEAINIQIKFFYAFHFGIQLYELSAKGRQSLYKMF